MQSQIVLSSAVSSFSEFIVPELIGGDRVVFAGGVVAHFILHGEMASYGAAFTLLSAGCLIAFVSLLYWLASPRWWRTKLPGNGVSSSSDSSLLI